MGKIVLVRDYAHMSNVSLQGHFYLARNAAILDITPTTKALRKSTNPRLQEGRLQTLQGSVW